MPGYKQPPDLSIAAAGGLATYVNKFLAKRGIDEGWQQFVTLMNYKHIRPGSKAKELGITTATYKHWEEVYKREQDNAKDKRD